MSKNIVTIFYHVKDPKPGSFKVELIGKKDSVALSIGDDLSIFFDNKETALKNLQSWVMCLGYCLIKN